MLLRVLEFCCLLVFFSSFLVGGRSLASCWSWSSWVYVAFVLEYDVGSAAALVCMYVSTGSCMT